MIVTAVKLLTLLVALVLAHFLWYQITRKLQQRLQKGPMNWNDVLLKSAARPVVVLIWFAGITFAAQLIAMDFAAKAYYGLIETMRLVGIILIIVWLLNTFIGEFFLLLKSKRSKKVDPHTAQALTHLSKIILYIISGLMLLQTFGVPISGVLAFGGAGTLIVGLASKDMMANFFGAITVFMDKPFKVGDWISSPDKKIEGVVEAINWRCTRIRSFDKRPIYVPNALFSNIIIENPSRMSHRRFKHIIGVRYDDVAKVDMIAKELEAMIAGHADLDQAMSNFVSLINFGDYSVDIMVNTYTKVTAWVAYQHLQHQLLLDIFAIVQKHGADIAYPTRVSISQGKTNSTAVVDD